MCRKISLLNSSFHALAGNSQATGIGKGKTWKNFHQEKLWKIFVLIDIKYLLDHMVTLLCNAVIGWVGVCVQAHLTSNQLLDLTGHANCNGEPSERNHKFEKNLTAQTAEHVGFEAAMAPSMYKDRGFLTNGVKRPIHHFFSTTSRHKWQKCDTISQQGGSSWKDAGFLFFS